MIEFHSLPSAWGLLSISPYCMFAELRLRIAGLDYKRVVETTARGTPEGVLPYARVDGRLLPNPEALHAWLDEQTGSPRLGQVGDGSYPQAVLIDRLIDKSLYWCFVHSRWAHEAGYDAVYPTFAGFAPKGLALLLVPLFRRSVNQLLKSNGFGDKTDDQVYSEGEIDIRALSVMLGNKEWFLGEGPGAPDAQVYALLANIEYQPVDNRLRAELRKQVSLMAFLQRVEGRFGLTPGH